jgi:tetratricopeptide (TPR) repeat protein
MSGGAPLPVTVTKQEALAHHQRGRLAEAQRLYAQVLASEPNNADALHLSGVLAMQSGNPQLAVERILRAITISPTTAFYSHLGEAYRRLGDAPRAIKACRAAIQIDPKNPEALNNLGVALLDHGQAADAREVLAEAVRSSPNSASAHNNLGNAFRVLGDEEAAIDAFRRAVDADPAYGEAHSNLGQLLLEQGMIDAAREHCLRAVALMPDSPQAHNNLGNALREAGSLEEAKRSYEHALRLDPRNSMVLGNIAQALQEEGDLDEALTWYNRALEADPSSARTYTNLASCLAEQERTAEARTAFDEALRRDPAWSDANVGLAGMMCEEGDYEEALAYNRKAISAKPKLSSGCSALAQTFTELGRLDEAEAASRDALRFNPENIGAYSSLASLLGSRLPDEDLERMQQLASTAARKSLLAPLHFGLAHAYDARGDFASAAEHAAKANAMQDERRNRQGKQYDPEEHRAFVESLRTTFTKELFERTHGLGIESEVPIFVLGLPRSGTTLVEQILASHSQVRGAGELPFIGQCFESLPSVCGLTGPPVDCISRLDQQLAVELAQRYLDQLPRLTDGKTRVTDKMPDNYLHIGFIHLMFPRARIIHCRRDLRDIAVSCWITSFRAIRWASREEHIVERIHEYDEITEHWRSVLPNRMIEIQYEELVDDPSPVVRRLLDWSGLEWEDACLKSHETSRPIRTASVVQVREPIYKRSAGRWRGYDPFLHNLFEKLPL